MAADRLDLGPRGLVLRRAGRAPRRSAARADTRDRRRAHGRDRRRGGRRRSRARAGPPRAVEDHDPARTAVETVLEWIDDGDTISRRLLAWNRSGEQAARHRAMPVLEHPILGDAFTGRVRLLWTSGPGTDITGDVVYARLPNVWEGRIQLYYERLLADFERWLDDRDLRALGRAGVGFYRSRLAGAGGEQ